uniref:Malonyl CoA-acyl carrier protein transacylase n=1 Tax=uncultured Acidobacteria bacterium A2 TaxID=1036852 RepID=F8TTF9_9BACT|nr:malonyl CoA-acyl carrier protein transacylase [uncultured Acidobacteria bacterium A2]
MPVSKIVFLFPGQGAQAVGMGQKLAEGLPAAKKLFDEANSILGFDLAEICFRGPAERLNATDISQPAIFVTSLAALEQLRKDEPDVEKEVAGAAGLSLGEYTALVYAGAMSFADGLRVVQRRGQAMQAASEASPSGMVIILGLEAPQIEELCAQGKGQGVLQIANLLCPGNIVVSGSRPGCEAITKLAEEKGARTVSLAVAGAFHTPLMKPADEKLAAALSSVAIHKPRVPVWSNVDAKPHTDPEEIRGLLVRQVLQPVLWEQSMRNLLEAGFDRFYEIGPGRVLAGLLKRVLRKADCRNVQA